MKFEVGDLVRTKKDIPHGNNCGNSIGIITQLMTPDNGEFKKGNASVQTEKYQIENIFKDAGKLHEMIYLYAKQKGCRTASHIVTSNNEDELILIAKKDKVRKFLMEKTIVDFL